MNETRNCPACAGTVVVKGSLIASDEDERFKGKFFPEGLKFFALRRSVDVLDKQGFLACASCGCLWNYVDPGALRERLKNRKEGESPFAPGLSHGARWSFPPLNRATAPRPPTPRRRNPASAC